MNILITGVSSGIGNALSHKLLDEGHTVIGFSRRDPKDLIGRKGFTWQALDLARFEAVAPAIDAAVPHGTKLDFVILNAGILGEIKDLAKTSIDELRRIMDVNVWSCKVVLDALWARGATLDQVVALSSGAALKAHRGWGGYAISKAALNMLMMAYAVERPDVHFTALAPGLVDTEMQSYMRTLPDTPEYASVARLKAAHGTPDMPDGPTFATRLAALLPKLKSNPSGAYLDVRSL